MKSLPSPRRLALALAALLAPALPAQVVTFTTNAVIGIHDATYDGWAIVVTNCAVTVDGAHGFASLLVQAGGVLTHSYAASGSLPNRLAIVAEPHTLAGTNPTVLNYVNVDQTTLVVRDNQGLLTYTSGVDYVVGTETNGITTIARAVATAIPDGAVVLVDYVTVLPGLLPTGLNLTVAGDVTVEAGGAIQVSQRGYGPGQGSGKGNSNGSPMSGSGGGHGGYGGTNSANAAGGTAYGSTEAPTDKGSSGGNGWGGPGAIGGGAVRLTVGGVLRVDGLIATDGGAATNSRAGGGAGGSLWLNAQSFSGSGTISANGGAGEPSHGGGGGGGHIAVTCSTNAFTGALVAHGGTGAQRGGAGTIFTQATGQPPLLLVDNGGWSGASTRLQVGALPRVTATAGAILLPESSQTLSGLLITSNAWMVAPANPTLMPSISVWADATVESGGAILADGMGYPSGSGPGFGRLYVSQPNICGGGAGHGGPGGGGVNPTATGGPANGSIYQPVDRGSGGGGLSPSLPGGAGGSAIRMIVGGTLSVNGRISANGASATAGGAGGGSGGSVWLTCGSLAGTGSITANGGDGDVFVGGGGGGGRIAINYSTNLFSGTITAQGGRGFNNGGAGTLYLKPANAGATLALDNGGRTGPSTPLTQTSFSLLRIGEGVSSFVSSGSTLTLDTLQIETNAWLLATNLTITVNSNATIAAGGGITADYAGWPGGQPPGYGSYYYTGTNYVAGGGSHGGLGGNGSHPSARGGTTSYGSVNQPIDRGSGGGGTVSGGTSGPPAGGAGGGALKLTVNGSLFLDGRISADGGSTFGSGGGGGAGGSLWLAVGTLQGVGTISANGGAADPRWSGGGGGGRVSLTYSTNNFTGALTARGGAGFNGGGAGTIYLKANSDQFGGVLFDNGGVSGPPTPFGLSAIVDVSLGNGARVAASASTYPRNLTIASNAWLSVPASLVIIGNATIYSGGVISADGAGSAAGQGQGAGRYYTAGTNSFGGGGAHGGYGGLGGYALAYGGVPYDSYVTPTLAGSGGGSASGTATNGGAGGGVIRLTVESTLTLDGRITAEGLSAPGAGGGGSGGSIALSADYLTGSGLVSANGGNGHPLYGGGGGGGRITLNYYSNAFTGTLRAWGGSGVNRGGAGTIHTKAHTVQVGLVTLDNGGLAGTNSGLALDGAPLDVVVRGAARWSVSSHRVIRNLNVEPDSAVFLSDPGMTVSDSATIFAGGSINADRMGNIGGQGQGYGKTTGYGSTTSGGGGSYGGWGGAGTNTQAGPGLPYGVVFQPTDLGSGGGGVAAGSSTVGGTGGGTARLNVTGLLRVDGSLSANGGNAIGPGGGGGSGGSVNVTAGALAGTGVISANGGAGDSFVGGGGGGGRIAISLTNPNDTNTFAGAMSAFGGAGKNAGGSGTIYIRQAANQVGTLLVDGGLLAGSNTDLWNISSPCDVVLRGRGGINLYGPLNARSLTVASNTSVQLRADSWSSGIITLTGDATIEAGARIVADGLGYAAGQGPNAGRSFTSGSTYAGGGGHGGYGGAGGIPQASGGLAIGSITRPTSSGSGGASATTGGAGGGVLQMTVNGTCRLDGVISANGRDPAGLGGGGGAGGSIGMTASTLTGAGTISANGGNGDAPLGGGGGGGRLAVYCATNDFTGALTAYGGGGANRGGAGTCFLQCSNQPTAQLVLDNGGWPGAGTPFASGGVAALTVSGGALALPTEFDDFVPSLRIANGGALASLAGSRDFSLTVYGDAVIESGCSVMMDGRGYPQMSGPGAGATAASLGSGAGHGGAGGSVPGAAGGGAYDSAERPVEPGSGGGYGYGPLAGGSEGGGALRLTVGGTLTLDGRIGANGHDGWQDNAGGGSGGSIWIEAGALQGAGAIAADGGWGELWYGAGGGGGRVAIYGLTNDFTGSISTAGGDGSAPGDGGSRFFSTGFSAPVATSHSPTGAETIAVSSVSVQFDDAILPASLSGTDFRLTTPNGLLDATNVTVSITGSRLVLFSFPAQNTPGDYQFEVGPGIENLFGLPMTTAYTGQFTLAQPVISGVVTNLDGTPVAGVTIQPDGGLPSVVTGADGRYELPVLPSWTGTVTPLLAGFVFVPGARNFTQVEVAQTNVDFLMVETIVPAMTLQATGTNFLMSWPGVQGVTYGAVWSTDLVTWQDLGVTLPGTNGPMQLVIPLGTDPQRYFRLRAQN